MIGASAALCVAGVPFDGPMGAARVGFIDGNYVLNPSFAELEESFLDMVVAGTEEAVLMVESEAKELNEDLIGRASPLSSPPSYPSSCPSYPVCGCVVVVNIGQVS